MATVMIERAVVVTIKLSNEEAIALQLYLGRSSTTDMMEKRLSREQSELLSSLYHQLPKVC